MSFEPRIVEARLALSLIGSTQMPALAWDALDAGLDGPAIRRMAALELPTFFEIRELLPQAMQEMGLKSVAKDQAALLLAKTLVRETLAINSDPFECLGELERLWVESGYSGEVARYGTLKDDVRVSRIHGKSESEIRTWLIARLTELV